MCHSTVIALVIWFAGTAGAQVRHWAETPNELIWRALYTNCDKGYAVRLPAGVVAHASHPPNPNHGFLISASNPGTTAEVTYEDPRVIGVFDEYDAAELGSARAYLDFELRNVPKKEDLQIQDTVFQGLHGVHARYRVNAKDTVHLNESLIVFRKREGLVYHLILQTTDKHYEADSALFAQIRAGFRLLTIPKGECSNQ
jgi:hypothetical protein